MITLMLVATLTVGGTPNLLLILIMQKPITKEQEMKIISLYINDKLSSYKVAKLVGVSQRTVFNTLKRNNIPPRSKSEAGKLDIDENSFSSIDEHSAYWIGFLMADGNISNDNIITLELSEKDESHVIKFKSFLKSGHKIFRVKKINPIGNPYFHIRFAFKSNKISSDLCKYGVVPRKSSTAKVSLHLVNNRDFWRGVIDGDGSIHSSPTDTPIITLVGSKYLVQQFKNFCSSIIDVKSNVLPHKSIYSFRISGKSDALKVLNVLYENSNIYLERKYDLYRYFKNKT